MSDIYLYWEGDGRHWYYDLCLKTILTHNPAARVLSRADVEAVLGPLPPALDKVYVTHRVDWIRKAYVAAVGGLWLDMDTVCFQPLTALAGLAADWDYVGYREWSGNWIDNLFAGRKGSKVLAAAADFALDQATRNGRGMNWLAASAWALDHATEQHPWSRVLQLPTHLVTPVDVTETGWFTADLQPGDDLSSFDSFGFVTSFHSLGDWLRGQSERDFLAGRSRLAGLVRRALG